MNQMVATLYTNTSSIPSSASQGNATGQTATTNQSDEEQQSKRKKTSEKSIRQIKRKKPIESNASNDIDGRTHTHTHTQRMNSRTIDDLLIDIST
jgi:hypothetical protein